MRSSILPALSVALALLASGADARTARDLSSRMRIDGYSSDFASGDEAVFGLDTRGIAQEARDDSKWQNNEVYQIHLTWDAQYLYVAVDGKIFGNNLMLVFDTVPNRGLENMTALNSWRRNVNFDAFGRFPGDEFLPDLFGATWDTNTNPRLITHLSGNQVDDSQVGAEFRSVASFDQGNDGRSMELAIPWRNVFAGLGGGGTRDTVVTVGGVTDTLRRMPLGVRSIKVAAFVTANWDGGGGPDSAPDNLRGHTDDGNANIVLDNYASVDLDRNDDTGIGFGGPDGIPDWDVSPSSRVSFRYPPPITTVRFSIGDLVFDRPAFKPDAGEAVGFRVRLDPPLNPNEPIDGARRVTYSADVYDASGRRVRNLFLNLNVSALNADTELAQAGLARWDGRDAAGRLVPPGIYVLRVVIEPNLDRVSRALVVVR
ncbi:MAG: hypothetical protein ABIS67_03550 [Candidatus Eisenbacteria bacterium]